MKPRQRVSTGSALARYRPQSGPGALRRGVRARRPPNGAAWGGRVMAAGLLALGRQAARGDRGQGLVEYVLILTFVAVVAAVALALLAAPIGQVFRTIGQSL